MRLTDYTGIAADTSSRIQREGVWDALKTQSRSAQRLETSVFGLDKAITSSPACYDIPKVGLIGGRVVSSVLRKEDQRVCLLWTDGAALLLSLNGVALARAQKELSEFEGRLLEWR